MPGRIDTIQISAPGGRPIMRAGGGAGSVTVITKNDGSKPSIQTSLGASNQHAIVSVIAGFYIIRVRLGEQDDYSGYIKEIVETNVVRRIGSTGWRANAQVRTIVTLTGPAWDSSLPHKFKAGLTAAVDKIADPSRSAVYVDNRPNIFFR